MLRSCRGGNRGFSLLELMVAMMIVVMALSLGMTGLQKGRKSGSSRGLATAVAAEFRLAREKAIAKGSPVAVVIPNGVARSLFFLEGDTDPVVTRVVNYEGDYPEGALTVAQYPGPAFQRNATMPGFKAGEWASRLNVWLPNAYREDFVFMFTPNGSVITNDLPSSDRAYRVIVSNGASITGTGGPGGPDQVAGNNGVYYNLDAAGEPYTVAISLSGAVESDAGLLGWSQTGVNTTSAPAPIPAQPPSPQFNYTPEVPSIIFHRVTPPAEDVDGEMVHILDKGEYLTLEVFANSNDGKALFAGWEDTPMTQANIAKFQGRFSVPGGSFERMEFFPEFDVNDDGVMETDVWRSVWTWTPPAAAEAGDRYNLMVDVKDATQSLAAQVPDLKPVDVAPPGEIVFEGRKNAGSPWHLYTIWADGSRLTQLTEGNANHRCVSATSDGEALAYQRNNDVFIMNTDGTAAVRVEQNAYSPTISPTGTTIAFMKGSQLVVERLDSATGAQASLPSIPTDVVGAANPDNRVAYSPDGRWIYYTGPGGNSIDAASINLLPGGGISLTPQGSTGGVPNIASTPQVGGLFTSRRNHIYYHADQNDPYIGRFQIGPTGGVPSGVEWRTSVGQNEAYPAVSPNGDRLLFCEQVGGRYQIRWDDPRTGAWQASGTAHELTLGAGLYECLRPAWIRQRKAFP